MKKLLLGLLLLQSVLAAGASIISTNSNIEGSTLIVSVRVLNDADADVYGATLTVESSIGTQTRLIDIDANSSKLFNFQFPKPATGTYAFTARLQAANSTDERAFNVNVAGVQQQPQADQPIELGIAIAIIIVAGALFIYPFFHARKRPFATERGREHLLVREKKQRKKLF